MRSKFKWIYTLLLALAMQFSFAQEKTVTGVVSDATGTLPGANVIVQGTKNSTQTDLDGKYTIKAKQGDVLVFSYVGMNNSTVKVGTSNNYNVKLASGKELETVVVTGSLGIKKKKDGVTNSFTVISAKEMGVAANPNAIRSLTGKVAGLQINNVSNGVNGNTTVKLRTPISFSTSGDALIIIDGVPSNAQNFASMPPSMIESVNVIKGAQGAAIYGELGVGGVIVVTTKRAVKGDKVSVEYNSAVDFETISFVPKKQLKYGQGWSGAWDPLENGGWGELFDGSIRQVGLQQPNGTFIEAPYTGIKDNLKQFYKSGSIIQNGVAVRVGSENAYANFSADNQLRDFVVKGDNFKRSNFLFKGGVTGKRWALDGQFNYRTSKTNQSNAGTTLLELQQGAANIPIGQFDNGDGQAGWTVYYNNPFWRRDNNRIEDNVDFYNTVANISFNVNKNLTLKYNGGIRNTISKQLSYQNELIETIADGVGSIGQVSSFYQYVENSRNFYGDLMLDLKYDLTDNLSLSGLIGHNMRKNTSNTISQGGQNLDIPGWYHIQNVLSPDSPSSLVNSVSEYTSTAEFANFDFSYKDYLFLNLTGRYEHVSQLLPGNRDYFYPSAGVSFMPTKWKDLTSANISYLKIFANYTNVGNTSAVSNYRVLNYGALGNGFPFVNTGNSFNDQFSFVDPNIKPEYYKTIEAGFVLGMFNDKVTLDFAAFKTDTKNAISSVSTSTATGNLSKLANVGSIATKGLEASITFAPYKTDNFNWTTSVNFSTYRNEVLSLEGSNKTVTLYNVNDAANSSINGAIVATVGQPFPYLQGSDWLRDDQGRVIINATTGLPSVNPVQQNLGRVTPDYTLGLTNSINYKGIGLSFTMDYRKGGKLFSETIYNMTWSGHLEETADYDRDLGFIYPNSVLSTTGQPNTSVYTAAGYGSNGSIAYANTLAGLGAHNVVDATAFKLREVSLSYSLPAKYTDKLGLTTLKFSINARNPIIILANNNKGYTDPEASSVYDATTTNAARRTTSAANTNAAASGFSQVAQYPSTRTFGFALNVGF